MPAFELDPNGYFLRDQQPFIPFGANYWPGSCGVEMWQQWPESEMQADLDLMQELGMNTIRFFLRWPDFEAEQGNYNQSMIQRMQQFLGWCEQRKIATIPTLFVGFMSGGFFWPEWKAGRNLFGDETMLNASRDYASAMSAKMKPWQNSILAVDLGNELTAVQDSPDAGPAACEHWNAKMCEAIKAELPETMVMNGHDHNQVVFDRGWRFDNQTGCDFLSMHSYPVPAWQTIRFDGMRDPLAAELLPYYVKCARAFGPVMVQEFGTIITFGESPQRLYLERMLPELWREGANGYLWWCLKDIPAQVHPYKKGRKESTLGIVDQNGKVKPGLEPLIEFGQTLTQREPITLKMMEDRVAESVGLYWGLHYYHLEDAQNPGNNCKVNAASMLVANHALRALDQQISVIPAKFGLPDGLKVLMVNGQGVDSAELAQLKDWVKKGGRLIWHGVRPMEVGPEFVELFGVTAVDFCAAESVMIEDFGGQDWTFSHFIGDQKLAFEVRDAEVIKLDDESLPAITKHHYGQGIAIMVSPAVDRDFAESAGQGESLRAQWVNWYRAMLDLVF